MLYAPNVSRRGNDSFVHILRFLNGNSYKITVWQIQTAYSKSVFIKVYCELLMLPEYCIIENKSLQ